MEASNLACLAALTEIRVEAVAFSTLSRLSLAFKGIRCNSQLLVEVLALFHGSIHLANNHRLLLGLVKRLELVLHLLRLNFLLGLERPVRHLELADLRLIFQDPASHLLERKCQANHLPRILLDLMRLVSLSRVFLLVPGRLLRPLELERLVSLQLKPRLLPLIH